MTVLLRQRSLRWVAALGIVVLGFFLYGVCKGLPDMGWSAAVALLWLVSGVLIFSGILIIAGAVAHMFCSVHSPLRTALAVVGVSSAVIVTHLLLRATHVSGRITAVLGPIGYTGLAFGTVLLGQAFFGKESSDRRTAAIFTVVYAATWTASTVVELRHRNVQYVVPTFLISFLLNAGLAYYFARIGAECVIAYREGTSGSRSTVATEQG